jgi:hypothetical protein
MRWNMTSLFSGVSICMVALLAACVWRLALVLELVLEELLLVRVVTGMVYSTAFTRLCAR